jgi:hypothetical protein
VNNSLSFVKAENGREENVKVSTAFLLLSLSVVGNVLAGKPSSDIPITHIIHDVNEDFTPYSIQSDGLGPYRHGIDKNASLIYAGGLNGFSFADRVLQNGVIGDFIRNVAITFSHDNEVKFGDAGYRAPANPPVWGTVYDGARFMNKCSATNSGFLPMKAGDKIICEMHIRMWPLGSNNNYYRLDMGNPSEEETERVQITCNESDSVGCKDWYIDSIPVVNADGSQSPGKTRARLNYFNYIRKNTSIQENRGAFYMTFHIHVTRP